MLPPHTCELVRGRGYRTRVLSTCWVSRTESGSHRGRRNHHGDGISTGVQQKGRVTTHSADGAILGPLVEEIYAVSLQ